MNPLLLALVESGVLSQADAERIERQLSPEAARLHAEGLIAQAFARGLTAQQRRLLNAIDDSQGNPTPRTLERLWAQENELLWASVGDTLRDVATEQAVRASIGTVDANTWMLVNEEVVNAIDTWYTNDGVEAFGSIPNLNVTSRTQFAEAFQRWQLGDRTPGNYAQGLPQLINELQPIFGMVRAERIGVTETTRIFSQAEISAGNANPFIDAWLYNTANDSYVSELCRSGEGAIMLKGESVFSDGKGPPPRHVRCRSSITQLTGPALAALREDGFVQSGRGPLPVVGTAEPREPVANFDNASNAKAWFTQNNLVDPKYLNLDDIPLELQRDIGEVFLEMKTKHNLPMLDGANAIDQPFGVMRVASMRPDANDQSWQLVNFDINKTFLKNLRDEDDMSMDDYFAMSSQSKNGRPREFVAPTFRDAVYHESVHYYHLTKLGRDNPMVKELYRRATDSGLIDHISGYASTNADEFFAEMATQARLRPTGAAKFIDAIGANDIWETIKP